jgi:hypothetical protein
VQVFSDRVRSQNRAHGAKSVFVFGVIGWEKRSGRMKIAGGEKIADFACLMGAKNRVEFR